MLEYAIREKKMQKVDVNEQNTQALHFYQNRGFEVIARDAIDGQGKAYPILHMQLKPVRLRKAEAGDLPELHSVFEQSVRNSCKKIIRPNKSKPGYNVPLLNVGRNYSQAACNLSSQKKQNLSG